MPPRKRRASETSTTTSTSTSNNNDNNNNDDNDDSTQQTQSTTPLSAYPINKIYRLIEPGPVLLVTTGSLKDRTHNIMTIGFHMMMQHESPALIGAIIGPWDVSYALLKKHRECVLAIPSVDMAATTVDIGNCSGSDVDKFERFGLEVRPAERVKAPLVVGIRQDASSGRRNVSGDAAGARVLANVECVVEDAKMVSKYGMWVLRAVKAWVHPDQDPREKGKMFHHRGDGTFAVDGEVLDLRERMTKWKEFQD